MQQIIEALIFASDTPLPAKKIKTIIEGAGEREIKKHIKAINEKYEQMNSPLTIVEVAGGYQIVTRPDYEPWIKQLYRTRSASHLTQKALETLAIIAYKQPITKQEIEAVRGVNVDAVMRTLIERNLVSIRGRKKAPGNPLLYGTTAFFLEYFGLKSLDDLPRLKEIDELLKSDDKFLESLDQVALQQLMPEELGLTSMLPAEDTETADSAGGENSQQTDKPETPDENGEHDAS